MLTITLSKVIAILALSSVLLWAALRIRSVTKLERAKSCRRIYLDLLRKIMYDADSDLFHLVAQVISFRSCIKDCAEGADYYANLEYEMRKRLSGKRMPDESGIPATPND